MRCVVQTFILALSALVGSHAFVVAPAPRASLSTVSLREGSFVSSLPSTASLTVARASNVAASRQR